MKFKSSYHETAAIHVQNFSYRFSGRLFDSYNIKVIISGNCVGFIDELHKL